MPATIRKKRKTNKPRRDSRKPHSSKRSSRNSPIQTYDSKLLIVVFLLLTIGVLMVYSGSVLVAFKQNLAPYHYFLRQLIWIVLGSIGGYVAYKIDYHKLPALATLGIGFVFLSLIAVLIVNIGEPIKRWIDLGPFLYQPSELAKIVLIVYIAGLLAKTKKIKSTDFKDKLTQHLVQDILPFALVTGTILGLILIQPDMDTAFIIGASTFALYFIGGNDSIHLFTSTIGAFFAGIIAFIAINMADYRLDRFTNWFQFWKTGAIVNEFGAGYQLRQILVAVASGGFLGVGFGQSRQKFHYLGETAFSDTIFAIYAEEFGLVGVTILILLFLFFLLRGFKIAQRAPDKLGFFIAAGITIWISLQAFLHIASNVAIIPINGNTLPFLSYGGSSMLVNLVAIGILLNISKHCNLDDL